MICFFRYEVDENFLLQKLHVWCQIFYNLPYCVSTSIKTMPFLLYWKSYYVSAVKPNTEQLQWLEQAWNHLLNGSSSQRGLVSIQSTLVISTSVISNNRLSRREKSDPRFNIEI